VEDPVPRAEKRVELVDGLRQLEDLRFELDQFRSLLPRYEPGQQLGSA